MRLPLITTALALGLGLTACQEKKFGGDAKSGTTTTPVAKTESGNSEVNPSPGSLPSDGGNVSPGGNTGPGGTAGPGGTPGGTSNPGTSPSNPTPAKPVCDTNQKAVTNIVLLDKPTLYAGKANGTQSIRYEVSLLSCDDGRVLPLKDENFQFDVNAVVNQVDMSYEAFDGATNKSISKGKLVHKGGADLFGNTGSKYGRWENGSFSLPEGYPKIIMKLNLVRLDESIGADPKMLETFFRIGETKAVKQLVPFVE